MLAHYFVQKRSVYPIKCPKKVQKYYNVLASKSLKIFADLLEDEDLITRFFSPGPAPLCLFDKSDEDSEKSDNLLLKSACKSFAKVNMTTR